MVFTLKKLNRSKVFQVILEFEVIFLEYFNFFIKHLFLCYIVFFCPSAVINKVLKPTETTIFIIYFITMEIPGNKLSAFDFGTTYHKVAVAGVMN